MSTQTELAVTLAPELYDRLRRESEQLDVPLEYLVAGLVLDTFGGAGAEAEAPCEALALAC